MTYIAAKYIAGERLEDLVAGMQKAHIVAIRGTRAEIRLNFDDDTLVPFSRAAERYAADFLVPGNDLSPQERFERGAQRVADDVARAIRNHGH